MNAEARRPRSAAQRIVFGVLLAVALMLTPAILAATDDAVAYESFSPRLLRVVLGDDSEVSGVGPARVEVGNVLFRLEDGLLVSLPFGRVKMIVPAWRRAIEEMEQATAPTSLPAVMKQHSPPASKPPGGPEIVITNADLPTIHRLMYSSAPLDRADEEGAVTVFDESGGVPQFDELYWRARARGVLDQLRQAISRVRRAAGHVSSLERFSEAMKEKGPIPVELQDEMATARVELEEAENLRDELILEWEELKAIARDAGAELGSL